MQEIETRPLTLARDAEAERRGGEALAALVSTLKEAAGDLWAGAALGGALGHGEGATVLDAGGRPAVGDPFEILAILDAPLREVEAAERKLRRALQTTARARRVTASVRAVAKGALPLLPPNLENLECVAANLVIDGDPALLAPARHEGPQAAHASRQPGPIEGLRLLVSRGASLLSAERTLDREPAADAAAVSRALAAVVSVDLALGSALLLSAGRWTPGEEARLRALESLVSAASGGGFKTRMTWTRFHDLVERHRGAFLSLAGLENAAGTGDARRQVARAADRFLEVLRLREEERLGEPLPSWIAYARVLERRHVPGANAPLFPPAREGDELPARRSVRGWPLAERLAPALAALLDWDPGDLPIVPVLLDLPADAPRDLLRERVASWAGNV